MTSKPAPAGTAAAIFGTRCAAESPFPSAEIDTDISTMARVRLDCMHVGRFWRMFAFMTACLITCNCVCARARSYDGGGVRAWLKHLRKVKDVVLVRVRANVIKLKLLAASPRHRNRCKTTATFRHQRIHLGCLWLCWLHTDKDGQKYMSKCQKNQQSDGMGGRRNGGKRQRGW